MGLLDLTDLFNGRFVYEWRKFHLFFEGHFPSLGLSFSFVDFLHFEGSWVALGGGGRHRLETW